MYATVDVLPEPPPPTSAIVRGSVPSLRNTSMRPASTWRTSFLMLRGDVKGRPWTTASRDDVGRERLAEAGGDQALLGGVGRLRAVGQRGSEPAPRAGRGARGIAKPVGASN